MSESEHNRYPRRPFDNQRRWEEYEGWLSSLSPDELQRREQRTEETRTRFARLKQGNRQQNEIDAFLRRQCSAPDQYIYGLIDPRDQALRYVGRSGEPLRRCQECMRHERSRGIPSALGNADDSRTRLQYYPTCAEADAWGEPKTCSYFLHELLEHGVEPTIQVLEHVTPKDLVVERECRWILHSLHNGKQLYNRQPWAIQGYSLEEAGAEPIDWLEAPIEDPEVQRIFTKLRGVPGDQYGLWVVFMYIRTRDVGYLRPPLSTL